MTCIAEVIQVVWYKSLVPLCLCPGYNSRLNTPTSHDTLVGLLLEQRRH
jgi:hypothetical protein